MFKKIASIAIAAMMLGSTAAIAASAVETDESAVAANDESAVAANDESATGAGATVKFEVPGDWKNFKTITFYLTGHNSGEANTYTWGSKKGNMTDNGDGTWSFDLSKYESVIAGEPCSCIFTGDWGIQTCNLIITADNYGDTAYCTGNQVENDVDSNKKSYEVKWRSGKNGNPLTITSIGNIIGDTYWPGEDAYSVFYKFISTTDNKSIKNAVKFNGKDEQTTIDDTAKTLGLGLSDVEKAVKEAKAAGADLAWDASKSSLSSGGGSSSGGDSSTGGSSSGGSSSTGGSSSSGGSSSGGSSSGGSSSGGSSSSGSSSSGSSSSGETSVTSGESSTVYLVIGGIMLAAIGVFFLARKKREY